MAEEADIDYLVRQIQAGRSREESFRQIFARYREPVIHFFANRGFSDQAAEDLAQDALIRVYKSIGKFRFEASFKTWLFQIVANVWKNQQRSRTTQKRQGEQVSLDEVMDTDETSTGSEPADPTEGPLDQLLASERTRLLREALEELPPKMGECVLLRVGQGLKYREIAAVMGVSIATVKSQLSAANQRLKPILEKRFKELIS